MPTPSRGGSSQRQLILQLVQRASALWAQALLGRKVDDKAWLTSMAHECPDAIHGMLNSGFVHNCAGTILRQNNRGPHHGLLRE